MKTMVVQKLLYPKDDGLDREMYVRCDADHVSLIGEEHRIVSSNCYEPISFDTYFSSFSYKKWKKYTNLDNVKLSIDIKGKCKLVLIGLAFCGGAVNKTVLHSCVVDYPERKNVTLEYPDYTDGEVVSFEVFPLSETLEIYEGAYTGDVQEDALSDVTISLAICTYRREDYIARNMQMLQKEVFDDPASLLHGHLRAVIADNGNTLDAAAFRSEYVRLVPNKNSGGSGGFSRAAIEIMEDAAFPSSHIILMDDDIVFSVDALERNYIFLRLLKPEYRLSMLGGAMFRSDTRYIQHAAGETQTVNGIIYNKIGCDMRTCRDVVRNEVEENFNYLGWWYCCIPSAVFAAAHYSLPLFVQYDDIEFSLRCHAVPKITLNGICCWHLPFDQKGSASKNYYTVRNRSIVNTLCFENYTKARFLRDVMRTSARCLFQFGVKDMNLVLRGAEDYLKGLSWLAAQDPTALHKEIVSLCDKPSAPDANEAPSGKKAARRSRRQAAKGRLFITLIKINDRIFPVGEADAKIEPSAARYAYRGRAALASDAEADTGVSGWEAFKQALRVTGRFMKLAARTFKCYDAVRAENRRIREDLTTEAFWKEFLDF